MYAPKPIPFKNPKLGTSINVPATQKEKQPVRLIARLSIFLLFVSNFTQPYGWNRGLELSIDPNPSGHQSH
jgi:hypothetical protein